MANSDATNKVKAGDAFHRIGDILASDPEAQKSWEKTRVEMQGFRKTGDAASSLPRNLRRMETSIFAMTFRDIAVRRTFRLEKFRKFFWNFPCLDIWFLV